MTVIPISQPVRRRRLIKSADARNTEHIGARVPVDIFRRMTEMVESPDFHFKTKSDMILEALEDLFEKYEALQPNDSGWAPFTMARMLLQREQRDIDFSVAFKLHQLHTNEKDQRGHLNHLVTCRRLELFWQDEGASDYELVRIHKLISEIQSELTK